MLPLDIFFKAQSQHFTSEIRMVYDIFSYLCLNFNSVDCDYVGNGTILNSPRLTVFTVSRLCT